MDTIGTEAVAATVELKEAFQVDAGQVEYQRTPERQTTRSGWYQRKVHTTASEVTLKMPRLHSFTFEKQIIDRYRHRKSSI